MPVDDGEDGLTRSDSYENFLNLNERIVESEYLFVTWINHHDGFGISKQIGMIGIKNFLLFFFLKNDKLFSSFLFLSNA